MKMDQHNIPQQPNEEKNYLTISVDAEKNFFEKM